MVAAMTFEGSVCVVTGASSGIGRALASALARRGARVWALGRSRERLDELLAEDGCRRQIRPLVTDFEDAGAVEQAVREVTAEEDVLHVLAHCAGIIRLGAVDAISGDDLDRQYLVNLRAPFVLTRELLPALRAGKGQVAFLNSSAAVAASADNVSYAMTKAGMTALADGLRALVNRDGVRVSSFFLGRADTPMQRAVHEFEGRTYRPERLIGADDVAEVVLATLGSPARGEITNVHVRSVAKPTED